MRHRRIKTASRRRQAGVRPARTRASAERVARSRRDTRRARPRGPSRALGDAGEDLGLRLNRGPAHRMQLGMVGAAPGAHDRRGASSRRRQERGRGEEICRKQDDVEAPAPAIVAP